MYLLELAGDEADEAFARREAASRCTAVEPLAPGLATARGVRRAETLAYTRRVCRLVGTCEPDLDDAVALLEAAGLDGRSGTVAVRARDVRGLTGVDTQAAERRLGSVLIERDFEVDLEDPDHTLVALFSEMAALGWLEIEPPRDFAGRRPTDKPFFQPGSMATAEARALVNIAGAGSDPGGDADADVRGDVDAGARRDESGDVDAGARHGTGGRLLDPMCGTGGILVEAGLVGAEVVGVDAQRKMVRGARRNLEHYLDDRHEVVRGDASRLPFADDTFDGAVFDAPYGRQSKVEGVSPEALVGDALAEVRRVATRAVVVGDRPWEAAARDAGWAVESRFDRRVHRSLTRYVLVLE